MVKVDDSIVKVMRFIDDLKSKSNVNILDLERFENIVFSICVSIDDLKKSRDKWKEEALKYKKELDKLKK